jgi:hypothetical protein
MHVAQRDTGIQRSGDERVTQRVWTDAVGDLGAPGHAAHAPTGRMTVQSPPVGFDEDRTVESRADRQIDGSRHARCQRHRRGLAALADDGEGAMPAFETERVDVGADRFGHS